MDQNFKCISAPGFLGELYSGSKKKKYKHRFINITGNVLGLINVIKTKPLGVVAWIARVRSR